MPDRSRQRTQVAISFLFALLLYFFKPSAFGQNFVPIGLIGLIAIGFFYLMNSRFRVASPDIDLRKDILILFLIVLLYLSYEVAVGAFFGNSNIEYLLKQSIITVVVVATYGAYLVSPKNNDRFFYAIFVILSLSGWSSAITYFLSQYYEMSQLFIAQFSMKGYEGFDGGLDGISAGSIYLPFSMVYGVFSSDGVSAVRFSGFFREAGIYPAFAAFAYILASIRQWSVLLRIGLLLGIVLSLSTAGIVMLIMALFIPYVAMGKVRISGVLIFLALAMLAAWAVMYMPGIGLADKGVSHGESLDDRVYAVARGISSALINPIGTGQFSGGRNDGINLISSMGQIGVVGFLLQVLLLTGYRGGHGQSTMNRILVLSPIFVTALISQPISDSAMVCVLLMLAKNTTAYRGDAIDKR